MVIEFSYGDIFHTIMMKNFFPFQNDNFQASLHKYDDGDWFFQSMTPTYTHQRIFDIAIFPFSKSMDDFQHKYDEDCLLFPNDKIRCPYTNIYIMMIIMISKQIW